jgi:hypothetical protein
MNSFSRVVCFVIISIAVSLPANARWAEKSEAHAECLKKDIIFKVNKDGTWTCESDIQLKVLTEAGRQGLSAQTIAYDATRNKFEILAASTTNQGKTFTVPQARMENKPLASDPMALRQQRQILIPFERVAVGSVIHLKTKESFFKPDFEQYFSTYLDFQANHVLSQANIVIESELPLFLKVNDPRKNLDIRESKEASKYILHVRLKKPIFEQLVGEPNHFYGEADLFTYVFVSTERDFKRLGKMEAAFYQPVLNAPLPAELEDIRQQASKIDNEVDCLDAVVGALIDRITYLGNWNIAEGHLTPRALATVIKSGSGDCKEYASSLAAILNRLGKGYTAKIALVERGNVYLEENVQPAYKRRFDHAIVKVIAPSGKTYWVDPTNNVSMANGIFPDIADRPALVLDPENPTYERIPPIDYRRACTKLDQIVMVKDKAHVAFDGSLTHEGEMAKDFTEALTMHPHSLLKEHIIDRLCESEDPINPSITLPACASRQVKALTTKFSYGDNHAVRHTNLGDAFPLKGNWYLPYITVSEKHEGALYVGHPQTIVRTRTFKHVSAKNVEGLAFSIQTPWLNAKRELVATKDGVVVTETIEQLKGIISAKDLKSKEFTALKNTLRKYCDGVSLVFSK